MERPVSASWVFVNGVEAQERTRPHITVGLIIYNEARKRLASSSDGQVSEKQLQPGVIL